MIFWWRNVRSSVCLLALFFVKLLLYKCIFDTAFSFLRYTVYRLNSTFWVDSTFKLYSGLHSDCLWTPGDGEHVRWFAVEPTDRAVWAERRRLPVGCRIRIRSRAIRRKPSATATDPLLQRSFSAHADTTSGYFTRTTRYTIIRHDANHVQRALKIRWRTEK